jgi:hypothetical protein
MTLFSPINTNTLRTAVLAILLAVSTSSSWGQTFAPLNAIWHYEHFCNLLPWEESCGHFTVEPLRDTMIDGMTANILEYKDMGVVIPQAEVVIREEANRVYFYEDDQFKLLYDFNLNEGDTMTFHVPQNVAYYDFTCGAGFGIPDSAQVRIDSTAFIEVEGQLLKTLYSTALIVPELGNSVWVLRQFTERIGSHVGLFGYTANQCLGGFPGYLRCYSDSLISYKAIAEACDFVMGQEELAGNDAAKVYPNPTRNAVRVQSGAERITAYRVTAMSGQLLLHQSCALSSPFDIDLSHLPPGIYVVEAFNSYDLVVREKVVKMDGR